MTRLKNPVLAARRVLDVSEHVMFTADGAEAFAHAQGLGFVDPSYFHTEARYEQWQKARGTSSTMLDHDAMTKFAFDNDPIDQDKKFATVGAVGAVALDVRGYLAAATSTGGITNKQPGRGGDAPLIGAGCYANAATCAVSTTGTGEMFMRVLAAYHVSAQMEYRGVSLEEAAWDVVMNKLPRIQERGDLIAVDARGNVVLPFNMEDMYRGHARVGEAPVTAIYR